jgi:hypothetical protein
MNLHYPVYILDPENKIINTACLSWLRTFKPKSAIITIDCKHMRSKVKHMEINVNPVNIHTIVYFINKITPCKIILEEDELFHIEYTLLECSFGTESKYKKNLIILSFLRYVYQEGYCYEYFFNKLIDHYNNLVDQEIDVFELLLTINKEASEVMVEKDKVGVYEMFNHSNMTFEHQKLKIKSLENFKNSNIQLISDYLTQ